MKIWSPTEGTGDRRRAGDAAIDLTVDRGCEGLRDFQRQLAEHYQQR